MKLQVRKILQTSGLVTGLAVLALAIGALGNMGTKIAAAADCTVNSIMKCGASSRSDFIAKVRSGNGGTQKDLATIYADYGLTSAEYNRFVTSARPGTAFRDGRIVVDGRTVATDAMSVGRSRKSFAHTKVIGGKTYWESRAQDVLTQNSTPVWVLFDSGGRMQLAVMSTCGNPTQGQPVATANFNCTNLVTHQINRTTYSFSTNAAAGNGATIDHVVYDFGDGTTARRADPTEEVRHVYPHAGPFTAKVTVYVKLPGMAPLHPIVASGDCIKQIVVSPPPVASCGTLTATPLSRTTFRLTGTANVASGAELFSYDFEVRNSSGMVVAAPSVPTAMHSASANVTISDVGMYTASLHIRTSQGVKTSQDCTTTFTVAEQPTQSTPSVMLQKDVDGAKQEQVDVNEEFTYHIKVINNGQTDLQDISVTDTPPTGVTLLRADFGMVNGDGSSWNYTIPSLAAGDSLTISLTAKVPTFVAGSLINKACVNAPGVANQPLCDTATVTLTPQATVATTSIPTPSVPQPQPTEELPNTGAGSVIGIFAGAAATGATLYRFLLSYRSIVRPGRR